MGVRRDRFVQRRKACGYTQEELAERLGVERSTVVRWERGTTEPQPWTRPDIQQALQVSADELNELLADDNSVPAREAEPLERRHLDTLSGKTLAASLRVPRSHGTLTLPALHLDEIRHIAAAVDDAGRYADTAVVTYLSRQLATCASNDGAHGPRRTLPAHPTRAAVRDFRDALMAV